jgi:OmpA-OmpF porin, OOP family
MRSLAAVSRAVVVALLWAAVAPGAASAQTGAQLSAGGMDLRLFRAAVDSKGYLTLNGTDVLPHKSYSFGLVMSAGFNLLRFDGYVDAPGTPAADRQETSHIVDHFFTGNLHFNYGLFNRLVLGVQIPIHVVSGPRVEVPGYYNTGRSELDFQGFGDITFHAKYRLLRADRDPVGLAAIAMLQLPSGDTRRFAGEPGSALWTMLAMDWMPIRRIRVGVNAGFRTNFGSGAEFPLGGATIPTETGATNAGLVPGTSSLLRYGNLITFGAGASFRVADSLDLVAEMYGTQLANGFGDRGSTSMEALGGLKIFVQRNSYLVIAAGGGLPPTAGFQRADYRAMLGFIFEPSIGDADGDGIPDDIDQCPNDPEDFDGFEDEDGCPDPDNDGDGILDVDDACPNTPGIPELQGCPDDSLVGDRDGDGIPDDVDQCPDEPEDFDGFQDEDGCPDPDNDGDGILDEDDMCPNEPETFNGFEDEDGCPDRGSVVIEDNQLVVFEKIFFRTDSAEILPRSFPIIDAVAATLNGNPYITLVEVQGHADERGSDEYNLRLTKDRAAAVVEAMVQRGVARRRLRSAGYGELCPVDPARNQAAWEKNRRVEFKIVRTEDGPTGVEIACPKARHLVAK